MRTLMTMQRHLARRWLVRAMSAVVLCLAALLVSDAATIAFAQGDLNATMLAEGEKRQVIQFNPEAALQKRIFADAFVPNSSEFGLDSEGVAYIAQRAESLRTGRVRIYYVANQDWSNVRYVERGVGGGALNDVLLAEGEKHQVIQFNPEAALQKQIFANGFVPNSAEFGLQVGSSDYTAQRAENLADGQVRVYFVQGANFGNIQAAIRGGGSVQASASPPPVAAPPLAPVTNAGDNTITFTEGNYRVVGSTILLPPPADLPNNLEKRVNEATVQLVVLTRQNAGIATGTVVGNDGHTILTAFHVVGDLSSGKVYDPLLIAVGPFMNYTLRATVIASDPENDLAVIRINRRPDFGGFTFLPLANSDNAQLREPIFVFSYPARGEGGLGRSKGSLLIIASNANNGVRREFFTEAVASSGSSGGVVVNANGEVTGIITRGVRLTRGVDRPGLPTIRQLTGYVPINLAKPLLQ